MFSWHRVCLCLAAVAAFGCGDEAAPASAASTDAAAGCEQLAGTWTIAEHCGAALKGSQISVTEVACNITTQGAFPGFTGEVKRDGSFSMSGTANGTSVACTGTATADRISQTCTGNCQVVLTR